MKIRILLSMFFGSLLFASILALASAVPQKPANKFGPKHLRVDEKDGTTYLTLCPGQKWTDEPFKGLRGISVRSDDPKIAEGSYAKTTEPGAVQLSVEGKTVGITKIYFDLDVTVMWTKTTSIFQITVADECGSTGKNNATPKKDAPMPVKKNWTWPVPNLNGGYFWTGEVPWCTAPDGEPDGDVNALGFWQVSETDYYLRSGEDSVWTWRFRWDEGKLGVRAVVNSKKEVAEAAYYQNQLSKFVISTKKPGISKATLEFAILPPAYDKKKTKIQWKKLNFVIEVLPTQPEPRGACVPSAKIEETPKVETETCEAAHAPSSTAIPKAPQFTVSAPTKLTADEQSLANRIFAMVETRKKELPEVCRDKDLITRQARKVASAFYQTKLRNDEFFPSCVDCAKDVEQMVSDALRDEKTSCIKITKIGRSPVLSTALHTATAVGPACTPVGNDWLVIDTWRITGNVPLLQEIIGHTHRVFTFEEWRTKKFINWGNDRPQWNLPPEDKTSGN